MKIALFLLVAVVIVASGCTAPASKDYTSFVACLNEKDISEYGAYWCPNCARVKLTLGNAYANLENYVECDPKCQATPLPDFCNGHVGQTDDCLAKGVDKYPTWIDANGQILYVGTDLEKVAEVTGCQVPE